MLALRDPLSRVTTTYHHLHCTKQQTNDSPGTAGKSRPHHNQPPEGVLQVEKGDAPRGNISSKAWRGGRKRCVLGITRNPEWLEG